MISTDKKPGSSSKQNKKAYPKKAEGDTHHLTPEEVIRLGNEYAGLESPIDISFHILKEVSLPPMEWVNFEKEPKRMKISNSGTTAILSAKWHGPRPYLAKGPLTGSYVFSQLHFHWGCNVEEGSEHTLNGQSFPLEVHLMFFKNTYITQEDAMKKIDGTVTVAYFFTLQGKDNEDLNSIISALNEIQNPLATYHLELLPLTKFLHTFNDDYFMYWGNVVERNMLWIISRIPLAISLQQLSLFHSMIGTNNKPISKNFRSTREINHRIVFHVNPSKHKSSLLLDHRKGTSMKGSHKSHHINRPEITVGKVEVENSVGKIDESLKKRISCTILPEEVWEERERLGSDDININISVLTGKISEYTIQKPLNREGIIQENITEYSCNMSPPSTSDSSIKLGIRRKSQMKFQLAAALLNLEKEEGNDYSFLEKYLKAQFESSQFEPNYHNVLGDDRQAVEMPQPSIRSLQMNCNLYEVSSTSSTPIKEKSKSDTHCLKGFHTVEDETDSEKSSVVESNKTVRSSINSLSDREDKGVKEEENKLSHLPWRPKTSSVLMAEKMQKSDDHGQHRKGQVRPASKASNNVILSGPNSFNSGVIVKKNSQERSRNRIHHGADNFKPIGHTVDEARDKIRSSLKKSMSKLLKMRGTTADVMRQRNTRTKTRPAWRY